MCRSRYLKFIYIFVALFGLLLVSNETAEARSSNPGLKSRIGLVVDLDSDQVLYEKNADESVPIASITKLMSAMVLIDSGVPLLESITITKEDIDRYKGSRSKLQTGTTLLRAEALKLALMASENRAAAALSRVFPGGKLAFVAAMNEKAVVLGMENSFFVDSTGLRPGNVSSAQDLLKLIRASMDYPLIKQYSTTREFKLIAKRGKRKVNLSYVNSNRLVRNSRWDIGLQKTGYISEAGQCLVMQTTVTGKSIAMIFLDSWGKLTRLGDAGRTRRWLERRAASKKN